MAYKALYRTYRPQTFDEVAGQRHIIKTLKNALATNKIAHAYLFCGPRGTGKTTMAKLFAKALNCEEGIGHQCNQCSNCREVIDGSHPDVIEIDAASNNGVEQVRDLIDKVNYLPLKGKYKVYIIDEVHMMTTNAFNALLKTLEEPPAHVIFILATTEPHNIIPTILSRCQRYDFTKVSDGDIEERMMTVLEKEGVQYDKEAVRAIISLADGGMRDALSILDQILAYSGNELSVNDVHSIFGLISTEEKINLIKDINSCNISRTLEKINSFTEGGIDIKRLTQDILEILKDVLIYKKTSDENEISSITETQARELSELIEIRKLHEMIGTFLKLQLDFKTANNVKTIFEIALLKLLTIEDLSAPIVPAKQVEVQKVVEVQKSPEIPAQIHTPVIEKETKIEPVKQPVNEPAKEEPKSNIPDWLLDDDNTKKEVQNDGDRYKFDDELIIKCMVLGERELRFSLISRWKELDSYLYHPSYGDMVALLKDGIPFVVTQKVIILQYDFEKLATKVNVKSNAKTISEILRQMLNKDVFVYAISRAESVRLLTTYQNLRQISKLPLPRDIKIDLEELRK